MSNANVEKIKASLLKEIKGVFCERYVSNPINVSFDEIDGMNNDTKILCDYKLGNITLEEAIKRLNDSKNE